MNRQEIDRLERDIVQRRKELDRQQADLTAARDACSHQWGDIRYDPIHREAYTMPGDPPGTMGVDRQLPCHVPAETTKRWRRTCGECGLTQTTKRTKEEHVAGKIAGTGGRQEVPDFGW